MKHTITLKGIKYSKYSDRGNQIRKYKLRHKVESTVKAVSILVAANIMTLQTVHFA